MVIIGAEGTNIITLTANIYTNIINSKSMFNTIRLDEAMARARARGRATVKEELLEALYPNQARTTQIVNFNNLKNGRTRRFDVQTIVSICTICGVSADWLFGLAD